MKQNLAESWDFEIVLYLSIYISNNLPLATIHFRMRQLNFSMMCCRFSAGIDSMISLTWSFIWQIVAAILFCWFNLSYNPKDKNVRDSDLVNVEAKWIPTSARTVSRESEPTLNSHLWCVCRCSILHEHTTRSKYRKNPQKRFSEVFRGIFLWFP